MLPLLSFLNLYSPFLSCSSSHWSSLRFSSAFADFILTPLPPLTSHICLRVRCFVIAALCSLLCDRCSVFATPRSLLCDCCSALVASRSLRLLLHVRCSAFPAFAAPRSLLRICCSVFVAPRPLFCVRGLRNHCSMFPTCICIL
ncbi:unnamed protein product [Sphenostylis stenocarpa]|uniref:Uncharacterized protein n=1 Tax=Sphenostylis stenocarpa TaxID=92480 RepID=A0AA86W6G6_9FABA|nr:unnamed protein product [Sphenostylis stenocarpa]